MCACVCVTLQMSGGGIRGNVNVASAVEYLGHCLCELQCHILTIKHVSSPWRCRPAPQVSCPLSRVFVAAMSPESVSSILLAVSTSLQGCTRGERGRRRLVSCEQYVGLPTAHAYHGSPSSLRLPT
mmetsp:Transcript_97686/g.157544  ORF Transcript_97686/g.157544 Transcript_97686/m.157544 type:complete len:126 (+) Transcript_97686:63-440(+)